MGCKIKNEEEFREAKKAYANGLSYKGARDEKLNNAIADFIRKEVPESASSQYFGKTTFAGDGKNKATIKRIL